MKPSAFLMFRPKAGNGQVLLSTITGMLILWGLFTIESLSDLAAYLSVTVCAVLPAILWLRAGAPGIPVLPVTACVFFVYYALPILRENVGVYQSSEILFAGATVCSFLITATFSWLLIIRMKARRSNTTTDFTLDSALTQLVFLGLTVGLVFHFSYMSRWLEFLGSATGVVRSIAITSTSVACFMLGHARARGVFHGMKWRLAVAAISLLMMFELSSIFLVGAIMYLAAAMFGYVITTKRVPWKLTIAAAAILFVLHSGKGEMRASYWNENYDGAGTSVFQLPSVLAEWLDVGLTTITSGKSERQQNIVDRASLLRLLMQVQRLSPDYIPFLGGETYALLPQMLVPRFLNEDKIISQSGMIILNVHYGFQTVQQTLNTAIGWGLLAEAYANFGNMGVIGIAIMFGILSALFTYFSAGAPALSLRSLVAVVGMTILMNPEADMAYMLTNLWQGLIAVSIFFALSKLIIKWKRSRLSARPVMVLRYPSSR